MHRSSIGALVVAVFSLGFAASARAGDPPRTVWLKAKCAVCHGDDGSGQTPAGKKLKTPDLRTDRVRAMTDGELSTLIRNGHEGMPDFKRALNDQQIAALVYHIRHLPKPR